MNTYLNTNLLNFNLIKISFDALDNFHLCTYTIRNLILSKDENFTNFDDLDREAFQQLNFNNLYKFQQQLTTINQQLANSSITLLKNHSDLFLLPKVPILIFRGPNNMTTNYLYNLLYAFNVQVSFILNLIPGGLDSMVESNPFIIEFFYNNFNKFIELLNQSATYYIEVFNF